MIADEQPTSQPLNDDSPLVAQASQVRLKAARHSACLAKAEAIIKANVVQAMTMGLIPVPMLDVVALTHVQFRMLDDLVKLYDIPYTQLEKAVVRSFLMGVLPVVTMTGLSSVFKAVPGIGSIAGSAGVSVMAGALTYATGRVFVRHFETGGNLSDLDLDKAKRQFLQEFRRGKKVASQQTEPLTVLIPPLQPDA